MIKNIFIPKFIFLLAILLSFENYAVYAQEEISISGQVVNAQKEPLPGVSIYVKQGSTTTTKIGTKTDTLGNFALRVPQNATLTVSYVGFKAQEVQVGRQTSVSIILSPDDAVLDEVVVVGYGTINKKDLTGAVSSVQGDEIISRKTTQVSQALQGAVPGVMVTRSGNAPGSAATIRIRGITTITEGGMNPLYILDGVPIDDINTVNPNDIENISVLKDAASASIYGSRAASGVILITTKRAKEGQIGLDYSFEYGLERATRYPATVGAKRFMEMTNELRWNDNGNNDNQYPTYPKDIIDNYDQLHAENPDLYPNTDWRGLTLNRYAPRQSHILSLYGASKLVRTRASLVYDHNEAFYDNRNYDRVTARINNDFTISKYLNAAIDLNYRRTIDEDAITDPMYRLGISPPVYAALWADGRLGAGKDGANIYGLTKDGGFNNNWYNQVGGKISLDFTPVDGLKLTGVFSPFLNFDKGKQFNRQIPYSSFAEPGIIAGYMDGAAETKLAETRNDSHRYTVQFLANYNKQIGEHNLDLLAGYEYFYAFDETLGASRGQYTVSGYPYLDVGPLHLRDNSGGAVENAYRSWFGRVNYNYKNKYLLQANVRFDASSRFAPNYRWGSFPSVSAGWVVSEESFLKDGTGILSFLKLRASYGTLGNERIGNYPYQRILTFENESLFYQGNAIVAGQSAAQWQYAIRDISWETTSSVDIGIDLNFFHNKLTFVGDYYKKTTKDMLLELEIPDYVGFDNPYQNTGKMYTSGWEFQIGWNDQVGDLRYGLSFNLSDFKSKMGDLGGTEFIGDQINIQGSEFNEWYGYLSDGIYQTQEEVDNSARLNNNVRPGDVRYRDISGPNGVPDGIISPDYDRVLLGGSLPRLMYGGTINLGYKSWDLSLTIQGVGKQNARLGSHMVSPLLENWGNFPEILDGNSWSAYQSPEENLSVRYPRYSYTSIGNNYALSDFWLINGGYFRLKNVTVGYNLPTRLVEKIHIKGLRLYTTVNDLLSIHNFPKGWDPEMTSLGYPITSTFLFGASLKF
ncbi:TonB-dependent receptor [Olivibacter sp. SDN3]|uniref:SusC/RagA family TonB-linked outer membrane protein n=1 Tax=Olivibacter sp. SDN3 TaxID=2764720 RepID=UPI0016516A36|nr:TonB-dependent receptor [Olivibacter sp. SDN3]QNL48175.1 TonB-dependent receptor [Olivibacter sp. SDN3]